MRENKEKLLNLYVDNLSQKELLFEAEKRIMGRTPSQMVFVNVDVAVKADKDEYLRKIINEADFAMVDGMPLVWISYLYGRPLKEKVSGSDFVPALCREAADKGWKIFLLGGAEGVPQRAAANLKQRIPNITICGTYSPPMQFEKDKEELAKIKRMIAEASPEILIVCFGCPKQEKFIYEHSREYGALLSICAGATVDFLAGTVKRCPRWISSIGMEWFYRFLKEPRRLFKRYFVDDLRILAMVFKYRSWGE